MRRRGRRHKQLLGGRKDKRRYWKSTQGTPNVSLCRTRFGRVYGPVV